jgi:hypothetical protein
VLSLDGEGNWKREVKERDIEKEKEKWMLVVVPWS